MQEPKVTLTHRYCSLMNRDKTVARHCLPFKQSHAALCVEFSYDGGHIPFRRVAVPASIYGSSKDNGAEMLYAVERSSGDIFEFPIDTLAGNKLYEVEFGEELLYAELRNAERIWHGLGDDFYTNDSFAYP